MENEVNAVRIVRSGDRNSAAQVARVESEGFTEFYCCVRPSQDEGDIEEQAQSIYRSLFQAMETHGVTPSDLITKKVFFSNVDRQFQKWTSIRDDVYGGLEDRVEDGPAVTFLHQPPCHPGRQCELQGYAIVSTGADPLVVRSLEGLPGLASGKVVEYQGQRHIYVLNLTGNGAPDNHLDFVGQAGQMFDRAEAGLAGEGATFRDVVRTWIYIADLERDYDAFNPVRTAFFNRHEVRRIPASTGIQVATFPWTRGCTMDLYALLADDSVGVEVMRSPSMNEAPSYGSSFSRGMTVRSGGRTVAYVSGTASIDTQGRVAHVGDIEGQVHRMLDNVESLLGAHGAGFNDVVTAITYLKQPDFLDAFHKVWDERGVPADIPNTVSIADVCRPDWLCEIEVIAVFPAGRSQRP